MKKKKMRRKGRRGYRRRKLRPGCRASINEYSEAGLPYKYYPGAYRRRGHAGEDKKSK